MKTFNIVISEEQLRLIRAAIMNVTHRELQDPGILTIEEFEEMDMIAGMILDVVGGEEEEEDTIHGFCY